MLERYRIEKVLREEKVGCILAATVIDQQLPVALKTFEGSQSTVENALQEALMIHARKGHPGLVRCYEAFTVPRTDTGRPVFYLSMELCSRGTLRKQLQETADPLAEVYIIHCIFQLASALAHLHAGGLAHKAVCLRNVFLKHEAPTSDVLLGNFLAGTDFEDHNGQQKSSAGELAYDPPESLLSTVHNVNAQAADIWGLGCVMLELMTGVLLDSSPHAQALEQSLAFNLVKDKQSTRQALCRKFRAPYSVPTQKVLASLLQPDPSRRPTAQQLCALLTSEESPLSQVNLQACFQLPLTKGACVTTANVRMGLLVERADGIENLENKTGVVTGVVPLNPNIASVCWESEVARLATPVASIGFENQYLLVVSSEQLTTPLTSSNPGKYSIGQVTNHGVVRGIDARMGIVFFSPQQEAAPPEPPSTEAEQTEGQNLVLLPEQDPETLGNEPTEEVPTETLPDIQTSEVIEGAPSESVPNPQVNDPAGGQQNEVTAKEQNEQPNVDEAVDTALKPPEPVPIHCAPEGGQQNEVAATEQNEQPNFDEAVDTALKPPEPVAEVGTIQSAETPELVNEESLSPLAFERNSTVDSMAYSQSSEGTDANPDSEIQTETKNEPQNKKQKKQRFPLYWEGFDGDEPDKKDFQWWNSCKFIDLGRNTIDWNKMEKKIKETLPKASLVTLQRIQHPLLWSHYDRQCKLISLKNGGDCNEKWLFHGTKNVSPEEILRSEDGLDNRLSRTGSWGRGIYFAENAGYSAPSFCYEKTDGSGNKLYQLFCARVATGRPKAVTQYHPDLTVPPYISDDEGQNMTYNEDESSKSKGKNVIQGRVRYDSVSGFSQGSHVNVVYKSDQVYPEYLITLKFEEHFTPPSNYGGSYAMLYRV